ncbi:unnamed protein product [Calicophoron daubneyi]|uniref:Temptin Cys/Cys disulfide domain-containing protein n=1 Tax=Calicophoron daubneyi TaxID=300641 RepID=A0AAV2THV3_CALDB
MIFAYVVLFFSYVNAYPEYAYNIPNGHNVPNPCVPGTMIQGVGHEDPLGGGPLNSFGEDYIRYESWEDICRLDSDKDGRTNGEELGDPNCVWTPGSTPERETDITHPGVCTPVDSETCLEQDPCKIRSA